MKLNKRVIYLAGMTLMVLFHSTAWGQIPNPDKSPTTSNYSLPIHGALSQQQIDRYYPQLLDTIQDRRIIGAEPIEWEAQGEYHVSMLHNTGTFDQMILCTHDTAFNLIDHFYIGKATTFDETSHTIEFEQIDAKRLAFHQVDWGWVKVKGEFEIDTLTYHHYILRVTPTGEIVEED